MLLYSFIVKTLGRDLSASMMKKMMETTQTTGRSPQLKFWGPEANPNFLGAPLIQWLDVLQDFSLW